MHRKTGFCARLQMSGDERGGGPGGLEVEAAGEGVDVQDFAGEEEAGVLAGFEGGRADGGHRHAAGGDKLLFELCTAGDFIGIRDQHAH